MVLIHSVALLLRLNDDVVSLAREALRVGADEGRRNELAYKVENAACKLRRYLVRSTDSIRV